MDDGELSGEVDAVDIREGMSIGELVDEMSGAGFGAGDLGDAVDASVEMMGGESTVFLTIAGALVPSGMKEIFIEFIDRGYVDVIVTTGANMVHDVVEALGGHHYHGSPDMDDVELHGEGIDRIYDVYMEDEMFEEVETHLFDVLDGMNGDVSIEEVTRALGESLDSGWLATAADNDVPVYCPAFQDSVIGLQSWVYSQGNDFTLDALGDMDGLVDICYEAESSGILILGGGVPKNYALQSMLVSPIKFNNAVQLTMDSEHTGGLSGATLEESISWGKVEEDGSAVTVYGDITITLPVLAGAVIESISE